MVSEEVKRIRKEVKKHHKLMKESIPLIASENLLSPLAKEMLISDFSHRYAEGEPGKRYYQGCRYIDEVEVEATNLAKEMFNADFADVRPISGVLANLSAFFGLFESGDKLMSLSVPDGGHISHRKHSAAGLREFDINKIPFDKEKLNIKVEKTLEKIKKIEPDLILLGGSVFLFPHPIEKIKGTAEDVGAKIIYDGAHVLGLIAGGKFQDPLREGADLVTGSTHKTFPGPQGGLIYGSSKYEEKIKETIFPGLVSNHHLHHVAALGVTLGEMKYFAEDYATQIIDNAKALAENLYNKGLDVMGKQNGFTSSHQVLVDVSRFDSGRKVANKLEEANIIVNRNLIPSDKVGETESGIRLGVQELTRLGMEEEEMKMLSKWIADLVMEKTEQDKIKEKVIELKESFNDLHYCYEGKRANPYKYIDLVNK
ncbi:MAG: Glycine/serine hydroxymethyltransferase GlyA [Candidatus Methanohalarchaeum thermophilum]|uniref:Serine hydroxymethyltransferase n=1 Tax=Methanohalarchaeum thermophilum TaxID=1903181 RepID=A0A1Q6DUD6_METT1|nr:MAG: Glycine/serine hydroxymethyltransferase GlyA [Candidatus Methanohalarchaeum thermophilum]